MRPFIAIALAGSLSACATMDTVNQQPTVQNAVYLAGDGAAEAKVAASPDGAAATETAKPEMASGAPLRKLYWFFSGR